MNRQRLIAEYGVKFLGSTKHKVNKRIYDVLQTIENYIIKHTSLNPLLRGESINNG